MRAQAGRRRPARIATPADTAPLQCPRSSPGRSRAAWIATRMGSSCRWLSMCSAGGARPRGSQLRKGEPKVFGVVGALADPRPAEIATRTTRLDADEPRQRWSPATSEDRNAAWALVGLLERRRAANQDLNEDAVLATAYVAWAETPPALGGQRGSQRHLSGRVGAARRAALAACGQRGSQPAHPGMPGDHGNGSVGRPRPAKIATAARTASDPEAKAAPAVDGKRGSQRLYPPILLNPYPEERSP
jgi:hypothetical protein